MTLPSNDNPKIRETVAKTFMEMVNHHALKDVACEQTPF